MRRGWLVAALLLGLVGLAALGFWRVRGSRAAALQPGPRVLLITLDTTRADYLGCYGHAEARTPNLDRLAASGVLFERCSAANPQTLPSHASILTGLYPFAHGVRRNGADQLPDAARTLAEVFHERGCATAAVTAAFVVNRVFGLAQGFDDYRDVAAPAVGDPESAERKADAIADEAVPILRALAPRPFFLWVHFFDPHHPYESAAHPDPDSPEAYADEIAFMDQHLGRLLDELERLGIADRTLVVVAGDHGEGLDEHGEFGHQFFVYETTMHVPLLLRYPGKLPAGRRVPAQVRTIDIAPTLLALTLDGAPGDQAQSGAPAWPEAQGMDLAALIAGQTPDPPLAAYGETTEPEAVLGLARLRCLTVGGWKYIHSPRAQLYDLTGDPGERRNLLAEQPARAAALREQLRALLAAAPPPLPRAGPELAEEQLAGLQSLGYVGSTPESLPAAAREVDLFEPAGAAPEEHAAAIALAGRAHRAMVEGRYVAAESQLRTVLAELPAAPAVLGNLAYVLQRQNRLDEARRVYAQAVDAAPDDMRNRSLYAGLLMDQQRWTEAIVQLQVLVRAKPRDFLAHYLLGNALRQLGRGEEAIRELTLAIQINPQEAHAHHALGLAYERAGKRTEAAAAFREAVRLDPKLHQARAGLARVEGHTR